MCIRSPKLPKTNVIKEIFFFMNKMAFSPGTWIRWGIVCWTDYLMMMHTEQTPKYCQIRRETMLFHKPSIVIQCSCPVAKSAQTIYGTYSSINWYGVLKPNNLLFKLSWKYWISDNTKQILPVERHIFAYLLNRVNEWIQNWNQHFVWQTVVR